ncbi:MAG: bifunctional UDP-sugar hydrolase/5'-nucleotidase [Candidatus Obscuribacterales bacterium]
MAIRNPLLKRLFTTPICSLVMLLIVFTAGIGRAETPDSRFTLTIIHTNDLHSHDEPYRYKGKIVGGMARVGTIINELRKGSKNVIVADAGDIFQGSPLYSHYLGEVEVALLNMIGYDVYTLGNHEFDNGSRNAAKQLSKARFDILNCNLDARPVPELDRLIKPYVIKEIDGQKVAFVGAITPELELLSGGLEGCKLKAKGDEWIKPIKEQVDKLSSDGIDKIILVTHVGIDDEKELAAAIPQVDAIIGGHSHTRLDKPVIVEHEDGTTTTVVQTGCYGRAVGKTELVFDSKGVVDTRASRYRLQDVTAKIAEVPEIKAYVDDKMKPLLSLREEIVGFASDGFGRKVTPTDSSMGDLICDALLESGARYGATISVHNRGGIRGELEKGPISRADVEQILPFDNYVVFATVSGKTLRQALEHSIGGSTGGRFLDVAGLKFAYDRSRPDGEKVIFVRARNVDGTWAALDPEKRYKIAVNHYNFEGGEGYDFKDATAIEKTKTRIADSLRDYLLKHKKVSPQKPNRIVSVTSDLLHIDGGHKQRPTELVLQGVAPGARLSLVSGSNPGVSTIYNAFPVPLENAQVVETSLKAGPDGSFEWKGITERVTRASKKGSSKKGKLWVCVVAHPPRHGKLEDRSKSRTIIAAPVNLASK